jgi:hypothetical protein
MLFISSEVPFDLWFRLGIAIIAIRGDDSDSEVGDNYGERSEPKKIVCSRRG